MGLHTHSRPRKRDRICLPRPERRQHWSGEGSAASAESAHRRSHAHSKATQAASLPARREGCGQTQAGNAETVRGQDQNHVTGLPSVRRKSHSAPQQGEPVTPSAWSYRSSGQRVTQSMSTVQGKEATGKHLPYKNIGLVDN